MGELKAVRLRCEHRENPVGIGETRPRFSWVLQSDDKDVLQESWQVQVDRGADFLSPAWDSGTVASDQSVLVPYGGTPLESGTRYSWRVRVSAGGTQGAWSRTASFETSLLDKALWRSVFIMPQGEKAEESRGMRLRREITVRDGMVSARVYATALGMYELSINGARVGNALFAPGWTAYAKRLAFQAYDVTPLLRPGVNALGATLGAGWYKGDLASWVGGRNRYGTRTALLLQLHVRYADGTEQVVGTDESWASAEGPILSSELYHGETYDARREQAGWDMPGFDAKGWQPALRSEQSLDVLVAQEAPPVRRHDELHADRIFTTPRGEKVLDFGQNLAGWVRFTVNGRAGDTVVLRHAEILDAQGNFYTGNLRTARARIEYILKGGGPEVFEPHFTFQGFRYVAIEEYPGTPAPADFVAVAVHSDMEATGTFECSHPLLNALDRNILWSLKGNFIDIPTDCPQRDERLGWTGDAQVFIRTACFHRDTAAFYTKWLRDLAAEQKPGGGVPHVVPDVLSLAPGKDALIPDQHSSTGWGDAAVICPWTIWQCYGDMRILERQYPSMKGWVEYIRAHAKDEVLWDTGFHFGDWVALDAKEGSYFGATPNDLTATAYYSHSTSLLARTAALLGRKGEARAYEDLHRRIVAAFQAEFFTSTGRLAARTQTAHVLALVFGLVPEKHRQRCIDTLLALIKENGGHLTTGFLGTPSICRALSDNGRLDDAYALLLKEDFPSWLYQVTKGATTIWEHWDGIKPDGSMWSDNMNSFNHYAYGAVGEWLYRVIGGLDMEEDGAGYRKIVVHPRPGGGLTWAKTELVTPYGPASIAWRQEAGTMKVEVAIPHNATARVILPDADPAAITGDPARFAKCAGGAEARVGSGRRTFEYPRG